MNMMDSLSSPLAESYTLSAFPSSPPSPTGTDTEFPIEVDRSFNSSMSISDEGISITSPTPASQASRNTAKFSPVRSKTAASTNGFLSPVAATDLFKTKPTRPILSPIQQTRPQHTAPAFPATKRAFGTEWASNAPRSQANFVSKSRGMMAPPMLPEGKGIKSRPPLPSDWAAPKENKENRPRMMAPSMLRRETEPVLSPNAKVVASDAMDIDSPAFARVMSKASASPCTSLAGSIEGSPGLGSFFVDSPAPPSALPPAKRRSIIDDSPCSPSGSPTAKRSSLGRNPEKVVSSSALLFPRPTNLATRRAQPYCRRPMLSAVQPAAPPPRTDTVASAFPILQRPATGLGTFPRGAPAPMRRAQSVCDQPKMMEMSEDESEFEASPSVEYARRTGSRVVPRVDGSPGFKPMRSSMAAVPIEASASPSGKCKKASPYGSGGLPRFGDNEMDGKILPCHKVKEDGLVRVAPETVSDLIAGKYNDKVKRYHIIDCRFEYEYEGGHIEGAIHVKEMGTLDQLLLSASSGVHANGNALPQPSRSGELAEGEQVVLIFHCEFSAKRAPTFAKHLRSRDRTMNSASYPKIFYPEVYILEGGYCGFFKSQPKHCDPCGYTPMDDPKHFERRDSDLHSFRNFGRTKSFTYGETSGGPACPPLAFAAASAAIGRRGNPAAATTIAEEEHDDNDSSPHAGDSSVEIDASPSLRVASMPQAPIFGSARPRTLGRMGFQRNASYAGFAAGPVR